MLASLIGRFAISEFVTSLVHYHAGKNLVEVDLLDQRGLAPFGRKGQRSVVLWIILSSIFSLFWLSPSSGELTVSPAGAISKISKMRFLTGYLCC